MGTRAGEGVETGSWAGICLFALGHSTRSAAELLALLQHHRIGALADIRAFPGSRRHPQFSKEALERWLEEAGIVYRHLPRLGGRRRSDPAASPNLAWRNDAFRAYADHMLTPEFEQGLRELRELLPLGPVALMCSEAVPWRCHRSLLADALIARGAEVIQLGYSERAMPHRVTSFARVEGSRVTYPPEQGELFR